MIRSLYRPPEGPLRTDLPPAEFASALKETGGLLWVDLVGEPCETCEPLLQEAFGFHPLAVEDALQESHVPKVDDWGEYIYAVFHAVSLDAQTDRCLKPLEVDIFLGRNFVVTYHEEPIPAVDRSWESCLRDQRRLKAGPDHLVYYLTDQLADGYYPVVDALTEALDQIQDYVFGHPTTATLEHILSLKRAVLRLTRITGPQREVLARLARDDYAVIAPRTRLYFRDVHDQFVLLHDINESLRDLVAGSLDTYLSVLNNRMNEVMKTLTVITTLFMPVSFIVGFFGMNFFAPVLPLAAWTGRTTLVLTIAVLLLSPVGMVWWMRRRGWM
ncbi:MAG: magnesium/cobalt transporter CorA [Betaproteobacteria bacterium]